MAVKKKKYSYIRNPYAVNGWYSLGCGLLALALGAAVAVRAVLRPGDVSLLMAAAGSCSIVMGAAALLFCLLGMREKERNHFMARIGGLLALGSALLWVWILL